VPYNPYLCQKYNCHINVEICSSITSIKYLYKYIYKGQDRVLISIVNPQDEIKKYVNARYVSASEAIWRLFNFHLQQRSHKVERLPIHLPNQQMIVFNDTDELSSILEKNVHTKLTRYFEICANNSDIDEIQNLKYPDFPKYFVWKNNNWHQRKRGGEKVISRLYFVNPKDEERFYLRMLLNFIPGATSFDDIKTIYGIKYNTFKEAAFQLGLVDDDNECNICLSEATTYQMPSQLRQLFVTILLYCQPASVKSLWDNHVTAMIEDFIRKGDNQNTSISKALIDIERLLIQNGITLTNFPDLPKPDYSLLENNQNLLIAE